MQVSPDEIVYAQIGPVDLNATLVYTWLVMLVLVVVALLASRSIRAEAGPSRWQLLLEIVVIQMRRQIRGASHGDPDPYLPFVGTLFLFIALSALIGTIPGVVAPTASINTTAALALSVFVAVPVYGVAQSGVRGYLRHFIEPTPFMLPFHLISEVSRTLALAVRLFGNMLSTWLIVAILVSVVPFVFPVILELFGLLIGFIQAYVFAILAMVYISSGLRAHEEETEKAKEQRRTRRVEG